MFDYPHLEVLLAVEREGSLERAAKSLNVTKSALSQTLGTLDYRMGAVTLDRKPMHPTRFGSRLCRHLEQIALLERNFFANHQDLFEIAEANPVSLRVAASDDALVSWVIDIFSDVAPSRMNVQLDIELMPSSEISPSLAKQKFCGAIFGDVEAQHSFIAHPLGNHSVHAVAAPGFIARHFEGDVSADKLETAPFLSYAQNDDLLDEWLGKAFGTVFGIDGHILPSAHGIANACADGTAWGLCSSLLIGEQLASGELVELVPGSALFQPLFWHIADHIAEAMTPITEALASALAVHDRVAERSTPFSD